MADSNRCTFVLRGGKRCRQPAVETKTPDGAINLCQEHSERYNGLLKRWMHEGDVSAMKQWVGFHVSAQGGPAVAAERMMGTPGSKSDG